MPKINRDGVNIYYEVHGSGPPLLLTHGYSSTSGMWQGQIEAQLADIEDRLARALVIDPTTLSGDKVVFGATVNLVDEDDKPVRYQLVGQQEANAKVGRISYNSPLGRALIGRQVGDEVEVTTPSGDRYYEIAGIEFV